MREEFDPTRIRYCTATGLVDFLDHYVKDTEDPDYQLLKKRLMEAAKRSEARNPFGAGRPERFDEEDKNDIQTDRRRVWMLDIHSIQSGLPSEIRLEIGAVLK